MEESIWEKPISHGEILKMIWKHLDLGVIDRDHPFHTPVFATENVGEANLRVIVLRRFWRKPARIAFHSHLGSQKVAEIEQNNRVSWLFYHPEKRFQLRIKGTAAIHTDDDLADEQWQSTELFSRRCYIGQPPSQISPKASTGLPENLINRRPNRAESEQGRRNFAVISSSIDTIDCMELDVRGHRRSLFVWNDNGELDTKWLTP